jgi:hypothetical protein
MVKVKGAEGAEMVGQLEVVEVHHISRRKRSGVARAVRDTILPGPTAQAREGGTSVAWHMVSEGDDGVYHRTAEKPHTIWDTIGGELYTTEMANVALDAL